MVSVIRDISIRVHRPTSSSQPATQSPRVGHAKSSDDAGRSPRNVICTKKANAWGAPARALNFGQLNGSDGCKPASPRDDSPCSPMGFPSLPRSMALMGQQPAVPATLKHSKFMGSVSTTVSSHTVHGGRVQQGKSSEPDSSAASQAFLATRRNCQETSQAARRLTGQIKNCNDMPALVQLVQQQQAHLGSAFNSIHAATALMRAAKLVKESRAAAGQFQALTLVARRYVAHMDHRGLSNCLWALASSGCTDPELLKQLVWHARQSMAEFSGQSLANTAFSLGSLGCHDVVLLGGLVAQARLKLQEFDPRSLSGLVFALAKLKQSGAPTPAGLTALMTEVLVASRGSLGSFGSQDLANTAWAMGTLEHHDTEFTDSLLAAARHKLPEFHAHQLATLLYALAKQKQDGAEQPADIRDVLPEVLAAATKRLGAFVVQDMANTAWSLAILEHHDAGFMQNLLAHARPKIQGFTAQGVANTAWAMAVLQHSDAPFMEACLGRAKQVMHCFTPQNLVNVAWALAKMGHHDKDFMAQLLVRAKKTCHQFNAQDLSNLLYALAKLQHPDEELVEAALAAAGKVLPSFLPQHIANTMWSLAKLGHYNADFLKQLLLAARCCCSRFQHQDLSNMVWALAQLRHHDPAFLELLLAAVVQKLPVFINQEIANVMWGMASLHHQNAAVVGSLLKEVSSRLHTLNDQDVANMMWALAVLDHDAGVHVQPLLASALRHSPQMSQEHLCQVLQWMLAMEQAGHMPAEVQAGMQYQQLRGSCLEAWRDSRFTNPSNTQLRVLHAVRALPGCADAASERSTEDGLFSMDITLKLSGGEQVAIEVDGPHHFMANASHVMDGATVLRNRMLGARGWRVVSVSTAWWEVASRRRGGVQQCLLQLLHDSGVQLMAAA